MFTCNAKLCDKAALQITLARYVTCRPSPTHGRLKKLGMYRIVVSNYSAEYDYEYEQLNDTKHSDIININYIMDIIYQRNNVKKIEMIK